MEVFLFTRIISFYANLFDGELEIYEDEKLKDEENIATTSLKSDDKDEEEKQPYDAETQTLIDNAELLRKEFDNISQKVSNLELNVK